MKHKELSKTFMMISNWYKPFGLHELYLTFSLRVSYIRFMHISGDYYVMRRGHI